MRLVRSSYLTGGDRNGNAICIPSSSARRVAALLETGARQKPVTGISQRHLSFVESGRSSPSRDFLSIVSDALNIPLRERNVLLLGSGFAPKYSEQSMDAEQMAVVTQAIDEMLHQHEPHPAFVLDRYWNVILTNEAAPRFFGSFVDLEKRPKPLRPQNALTPKGE